MTFEGIKFAVVSLFLFLAWLVASEGWVRVIAVIWLIWPIIVGARLLRRRDT